MLLSPYDCIAPTTSIAKYAPGASLSNVSIDPAVVSLLLLLKSNKTTYSLNPEKTFIEYEDLPASGGYASDSLALITMGKNVFPYSTLVDSVLVPLIRKQVNSLDTYW